jgi:hypothetical protein
VGVSTVAISEWVGLDIEERDVCVRPGGVWVGEGIREVQLVNTSTTIKVDKAKQRGEFCNFIVYTQDLSISELHYSCCLKLPDECRVNV